MRKINKALLLSLLLLLLAMPVFSQAAKEAEDDEILVKVLSVTEEDGTYSIEVRTEDGNVVIYHASEGTETSSDLDAIVPGDFLMVTDTGMMTMSLPAQVTARTLRVVTAEVKNGLIEADFSAPVSLPGVSITFGSPDSEDIVSLFSYSYGYLSMKALMSQNVYPDGGYFARGIIDASLFMYREPLITYEDMDASIDEFINEYIDKELPSTYGTVITTLDAIEELEAPVDLEKKFAYGYGYLSTLNLMYNGLQLYGEEFAAASLSALYGASVPFGEDAMNGYINDYINALQAEYQAYVDEMAASNLALAQAYLEDNAQREDVIVLPTGVQIEFELIDGGSDVKPVADDTVTVNYRLRLMDGTLMDQGSNVQFPLMNLIPGFRDAVMMMSPGDVVIAVVPPDQGYGETGAGNIEPNSLLIFEICLVSIDRD